MASILAVDDQKMMRELVKTVLESDGHQVTTAEDGVEALSIARGQAVDMVLTDINMPNMNGITLVGELRKLPSYKDTPIIMLTTESADFKKEKARSVGANGWLQKPFDPPRLIKAVRSSLAKAGHVMPAA